MTKKTQIIGGAIFALISIMIIGVIFFINNNRGIIGHNTTIQGNYHVPVGEKITLRNGAKLSVTGEMTIDGTLACDKGTLALVVGGTLRINGTIQCFLDEQTTNTLAGIAIELIAPHIEFSKDSEVDTNSHVDIVSSQLASLNSEEAVNASYEEAMKTTGGGLRIGPFVGEDKGMGNGNFFADNAASNGNTSDTQPLIALRGIWHIGDGSTLPQGMTTPPPPLHIQRILFRVDPGKSGRILMEDFELHGPDGKTRAGEKGVSCTARGENGGDAFRILMNAGYVTIKNTTISLGNGGDGGDAETSRDCPHALAMGGNGGESGNLKITGEKELSIGDLHVIPGAGGRGGNAVAIGKNGTDSCPGENGGDATAIGGNGGKNKKVLSTAGTIDTISDIHIDRVIGGRGGNAVTNPGMGGGGNACGCTGGRGGNGKAVGGQGGDATVFLPATTAEAHGGDGGDADTRGGVGGQGGSCTTKTSGGIGGQGGDAFGTSGLPGKGTTATGNVGTINNESGGQGGVGGDGCGGGFGGQGGVGAPLGISGMEGKINCSDGTSANTINPGGGKTATVMIRAVLYKGKYLPLDQMIITNEPGCGAEHWRAEQDSVRATDNTIIPDTDLRCGYGKVSENEPVLVPAQVEGINTTEVASTSQLFQIKLRGQQ